MKGVLLTALVLIVPGCYPRLTLDKTGTNDLMRMQLVTQALEEQEPAKAGSFLAEREGHSEGCIATRCAERGSSRNLFQHFR